MRIVGGHFRGKTILSPLSKGTRPTSDRTRETIFNILLHNPAFGSKVLLDKKVLDVFAGTGALGLEAYSRGAKEILFIEKDPPALAILKENVGSFKLPPQCILREDALQLGLATQSYDLIFMDPPYHKGLIPLTLERLRLKQWIGDEAVLVIEMANDESFEVPSYVKVEIERKSGAAKLLFMIYQAHT